LEGINFKDERLIRSPFFADRIKSYFDRVIVNHPDTVIKEMDKILSSCVEGGLTYNTLLAHFTYTSEQNKIMGFDKVFVHLGDKYIVSGHAKGVYTEENTKKIKERIDIMRNLLLDSKVPDLLMIDTVYAANVLKMGFDTAKTSSGVTDLYNRNLKALTPMFKSLYNVKAKYTVLVFWAADCGHCQTEIPSLNEGLKELKGKVDFKVYAVQTKDELLPSWKKFIVENKMNDFINVFDPIHLNNLKDQFDIYSTPVIYILDSEKRIKAKRLDAGQVVQILGAWENVPVSEKSEKKKS
jgi:thiol-disulfide isomerase/thioredoxin